MLKQMKRHCNNLDSRVARLSIGPNSKPYTLASCALLASFLIGCSEPPPPVEVIPSVKVTTVEKLATGQSRRISGKVDAQERSTLSFGVSGRIEEIIVTSGQTVTSGQLLARLDDEPFQLKLTEARTRLVSARAKLVEAEAAFERTKKLVSQRAAPRKDLDSARSQLTAVGSEVRATQSALTQTELDLAKTKLKAPMSGQIAEVPVDAFQEVAASEAVVVLQATGALEVNLLVPETLIRDVDYGQPVQVTFPTVPDVKLSGGVTKIGVEAEAGNAFAVTVSLQETEEDIRPGMTASVTFNFTDYLGDRTAYLIPLSAIAIDAGLKSSGKATADQEARGNNAPVFVFDPETSTLQQRQLEIGDLRGNEIEVFKGLEPGDQVVTAGVALLRDGMHVKIWASQEAGSR